MDVITQKKKRKRYLVRKKYQLGFVMKLCLLLIAGAVISTALMILFSQDTLTTSFHQSRVTIKNTGIAILPSVVYTHLLSLALVILVSAMIVIVTTHRLAGPMVRLAGDLRKIGNGDLTHRITFRKKDQANELADSFNETIDQLQNKINTIKQEVRSIRALADSDNSAADLDARLQRLEDNIQENFQT